ncbi:hypothetical protein M0R19_04815 [Candidatus Pacearchaeota archaeon]|jgi:hypothetical protein|nr:hypothetical protein [Candidatus Pacearchaeota archaeon]
MTKFKQEDIEKLENFLFKMKDKISDCHNYNKIDVDIQISDFEVLVIIADSHIKQLISKFKNV